MLRIIIDLIDIWHQYIIPDVQKLLVVWSAYMVFQGTYWIEEEYQYVYAVGLLNDA